MQERQITGGAVYYAAPNPKPCVSGGTTKNNFTTDIVSRVTVAMQNTLAGNEVATMARSGENIAAIGKVSSADDWSIHRKFLSLKY